LERKDSGTAYAFWFLGCLGIAGVHRIYLGYTATGVIWLLTGGLLGIGQLIDLLLIPGMTAAANRGR